MTFFFCVGNFKIETWNWELDDRLILTKNFKYLNDWFLLFRKFCLLLEIMYEFGNL